MTRPHQRKRRRPDAGPSGPPPGTPQALARCIDETQAGLAELYQRVPAPVAPGTPLSYKFDTGNRLRRIGNKLALIGNRIDIANGVPTVTSGVVLSEIEIQGGTGGSTTINVNDGDIGPEIVNGWPVT